MACLVSAFHSVHSNCFGLQVIIDVDLLGFVYHWGLDVNGITVIGTLQTVVDTMKWRATKRLLMLAVFVPNKVMNAW